MKTHRVSVACHIPGSNSLYFLLLCENILSVESLAVNDQPNQWMMINIAQPKPVCSGSLITTSQGRPSVGVRISQVNSDWCGFGLLLRYLWYQQTTRNFPGLMLVWCWTTAGSVNLRNLPLCLCGAGVERLQKSAVFQKWNYFLLISGREENPQAAPAVQQWLAEVDCSGSWPAAVAGAQQVRVLS